MTILSVLGTNNYQTTTYVWGERRRETSVFPAALAAWFPDATLKVLATDAAWDKHGAALCASADCGARVERLTIPAGADEDELWTIFNTLAGAIPEGEEVVFDITHGFRSLPVLALLATAFLRVAKKVRVRHLLYGAFEQKNSETNQTPVFDLTPFVDLLDWTAATERFLETGDARKFAALVAANRRYSPKDVGASLQTLSEALLTNRPALAQAQAQHLSRRIEEARKGEWEARHAPFQMLLERIAESFSPLADAEPLHSQWAQIRWLAEHGHYPAAAALSREWIVSVRVWVQNGSVLPVRQAKRDEAEKWLNAAGRDGNEVPEGWQSVVTLWGKDPNLTELRNDVMHCGMREHSKGPQKIQEKVIALPGQLAEAVRPLGLDLKTEATP